MPSKECLWLSCMHCFVPPARCVGYWGAGGSGVEGGSPNKVVFAPRLFVPHVWLPCMRHMQLQGFGATTTSHVDAFDVRKHLATKVWMDKVVFASLFDSTKLCLCHMRPACTVCVWGCVEARTFLCLHLLLGSTRLSSFMPCSCLLKTWWRHFIMLCRHPINSVVRSLAPLGSSPQTLRATSLRTCGCCRGMAAGGQPRTG